MTDTLTAPAEPPAAPPPEPVPASRPVRRTAPANVALVIGVLRTLAVGLLGFVVYLALLTPLSHAHEQDWLYDTLRGQLAEGTAPVGGPITPGAPVALLRIDGLGVDEVVVEGTASGDLMSGPGHRRDTVLPGQPGVSLLLGRAWGFSGPFRDLDRLQPGDPIEVTTGQGRFTYQVDRVRRDGDPIPPVPGAGRSRLTLVTAEGPPFLPRQTVLVDASLAGETQPAPGPAVRRVPRAEQSMGADRAAVLPLVLWLQALGLVLAGLVWGRHRWGAMQTWVVGTPALLAVLWNVYEAVARLLPNLL